MRRSRASSARTSVLFPAPAGPAISRTDGRLDPFIRTPAGGFPRIAMATLTPSTAWGEPLDDWGGPKCRREDRERLHQPRSRGVAPGVGTPDVEGRARGVRGVPNRRDRACCTSWPDRRL